MVICEDSKSGLNYLKNAKTYLRVDARIEILHCGKTDPKGIVEYAIGKQNKFDYVYCVIDRDNHSSFSEAHELARHLSNGQIIASFPCFEFWLLLHFGYCRKPYQSADCLIKELSQKPGMENYYKGGNENIFALLNERFSSALQDASRVLDDVRRTDEPNPSTELHIVLEHFIRLSIPTPIA